MYKRVVLSSYKHKGEINMKNLINDIAEFLDELEKEMEKLVFDTRFILYGFFISTLAISTGISIAWALVLLPFILYADEKMGFKEWGHG